MRGVRSRDSFPVETAAANVPDAVRPKVLEALEKGRLGVSFSGAGFGAAYQLGAAHVLSSLGLLHRNSPVSGTSAGGLVAVSIRCGIPETDMLSALKEASSDLLAHGWKGRIRSVLKPVVERLLPPDAHEQCNSSPEVLLTATEVSGPCPMCWKSQVFEEPYTSREDLVQRLLVAVHEPKETDGRLCVPYRNHHYADGGMRVPVPPVQADYSLIIYPVCNGLLTRLWPYKMLLHPPKPEAVAISPGQYRPWPLSKSYKDSSKLVMHPQPNEMLDLLFERGRRDALSWAQHIGLTATAISRGPHLHSDQQVEHTYPQQMNGGAAGVGAQGPFSIEVTNGLSDDCYVGRGAVQSGSLTGERQSANLAAKPELGSTVLPEGAGVADGIKHSLLSTPVEQLPMVMHVEAKMLHML